MPSERPLDVRGGVLVVDDAGGAGRPLVWAHGLTSSRRHEDETGLLTWSSLVGVRVIRYDARGHGQSGGPPDPRAYAWASLGLDLLDVMTVTGVERAAIGGASMGCASALVAALAAPERVERLLLVIPPTAWEKRALQSDLYRVSARLVETDGLGALAEQLRQQLSPAVFGEDARRLRDLSMESLLRMDPTLVPHILRGAAASDLPDVEQLATITQPALILAWTGDQGHPVSTAERLADVLPDAELDVAGDLDAIRAWPARVAEFLAE